MDQRPRRCGFPPSTQACGSLAMLARSTTEFPNWNRDATRRTSRWPHIPASKSSSWSVGPRRLALFQSNRPAVGPGRVPRRVHGARDPHRDDRWHREKLHEDGRHDGRGSPSTDNPARSRWANPWRGRVGAGSMIGSFSIGNLGGRSPRTQLVRTNKAPTGTRCDIPVQRGRGRRPSRSSDPPSN